MIRKLLVLVLLLQGCSDGTDEVTEVAVPASSLTVRSSAAPEGAPGEMKTLTFYASVTEPQPLPVEITYQTSAGTAVAGVDYLETMGTAEISAGSLATTIDVELMGDAEEEEPETFSLNFETSSNAIATSSVAIGTIANDDTACNQPFSKTPNPWLVNGADPLNYAHRGGVIDFPENTLFAYSEVMLAGADVLETDVYQTADSGLVMLHDLDVDRTTDGTGLVVDLSLAEIGQLDAAYWFVPGAGTPHDRPEEDYIYRGIATGDKPPPPGYTAADFRIPTLEKVLQRFPDTPLNIELKPDLDEEGNYENQIASLLSQYGRYTDVIVGSFIDAAVNNFKAVAPCVYTFVPLDLGTILVLGAQGAGTFPDVPEHIAFQVPRDTSSISQVPESLFLEVVNEDFVTDAHNANLAVQVWTVNSCEEMLRMMDLGVDAIMTDRPLLLESILNTPKEERICSQ